MKKKIGFWKTSALVSFVLIFALVLAIGAAAVEDSPLAGGLIEGDGPSTNDIISIPPAQNPLEVPPPADEGVPEEGEPDNDASAEDEFVGDESVEDEFVEGEPEEGEPAEDIGDLFEEFAAESAAPAAKEQAIPKNNPKTGDGTVLFALLSAISLVGAGVYSAKRKAK